MTDLQAVATVGEIQEFRVRYSAWWYPLCILGILGAGLHVAFDISNYMEKHNALSLLRAALYLFAVISVIVVSINGLINQKRSRVKVDEQNLYITDKHRQITTIALSDIQELQVRWHEWDGGARLAVKVPTYWIPLPSPLARAGEFIDLLTARCNLQTTRKDQLASYYIRPA
jgi:hypothetical protein